MNHTKSSTAYLFIIFNLFFGSLFAQNPNPLIAPDFEAQKAWVDSIYGQMSLEEKIGQLFMVQVASENPESEKIEKLIEEYHIGGLIFSTGGPQQQAQLTNAFQEMSKIPLLIGMDAEWGLAMRLDSTLAFPWNMTLGAIQDNQLLEEVGAAIGRNMNRLGVHINFAPVVDINTNPKNPIIGNRSYGENRLNVAQKAVSFLEGMQQKNVLSTAKHFPGHGDTSIDSHKALPTVDFSLKRLDSVELYPYKKLIQAGLPAVMVAHLNVPALEETMNLPSSLSKSIVTGILKEDLKFNGLIITDALGMQAITDGKEPGEADLMAFLAGNDILLMSENVPLASKKLIEAYNSGVITEERLQHSVRKILFAKYKVGLNNYEPVDTHYLIEDLNTIKNKVLYYKLMENALTVIKNDKAIVPIKNLRIKKIAYVHFGEASGEPFYDQLTKYADVDWIKADHLNEMLKALEKYNLVIVGFHKSNASPWKDYSFTEKELVWLYEIARKNRIILNIFASPYALLDMETTSNFEGIVIGYQNSPIAQKLTAQLLFGAITAKGRLPVSVGENFPAGTGYNTKFLHRLSYGLPESVGMNSYKLKKVDSLIKVAIEQRMTPGLQVLVARKGKVIYNNSAGYHTYDKKIPVSNTDVYDLASLTKILATLPLVMELVGEDELDLDTTLGEIFPSFEGSNKEDVTIKRMLSHYARFQPWIPFYRYTLDPETGEPSKRYYRNQSSRGYNTPVAEGMYIRNDIRDSIIKTIRDSELRTRLEYRYSDLPFYLLKQYLERTYGTSLDYLTQVHFYESMGAYHTTYLPLNHFPKNKIIPTENDKTWRHQLLIGYVHDEGAAMLGGIGGQAGLFSNANGVAKIMQMYLNGGIYGGIRYLKEETINKFNTRYFAEQDVRRGVGFDKPQLDENGNWPTFYQISDSSFGHSGFTGTYTWADPEKEIVYVFLSNRIHPSPTNNKLSAEDMRVRIQKAVYEAIDY
ncbi:MAG TPA: glycoside hydrolase family 3 N-terminal domain-containing protein [Salinimicrobium sp.]|nr:glycoside hydrolase family 3 N-terminal domain-containing protein [Salinimicrobium sp.]